MSEKINHHEHRKPNHSPEADHTVERHTQQQETKHIKHEHQKNIDDIQKSIEHHAKKSHEVHHNHSPETAPDASEAFVTKELKTMALQRTMHRIRRQLSPIDKSASKLIHNQAVDKISEVAGQTVARPSAMLGAGILSATGGLIYFLITKHYGYDYNPTVLFVLFIAGFGLGLFIELLRKLSSSRT